MNRWTDPDGHSWPITEPVCAVCHLPMIVYMPDQKTHPTCDSKETRP